MLSEIGQKLGTIMARCVVIEDSERVREVTVEAVKSFGLETVGVETAEAGIEEVRREIPDVVLLDWDLPKLAALDFLSGLADAQINPKPVTILMAVENDPKQFSLARAAGATHYVLKPFDREDLAKVFAKAGLLSQSGG